jgi:hypothetical protein
MRLGKCPSPEQWDVFLMTAPEGRDVELIGHLEACEYCQVTVQNLAETLRACGYGFAVETNLQPILLRLHEPEMGPPAGMGLLAAQASSAHDLTQSITHVSSDKALIMKAVRDARKGETWIFLMAEDPTLVANVLVRPFGLPEEYITDQSGRVNIGAVDWSGLEAQPTEVRVPKASFTLTPLTFPPDARSSAILSNAKGDEIRVVLSYVGSGREMEIEVLTLSGLAEDSPLRVALRDPVTGSLQVSTCARKIARMAQVPEFDAVQIFFYQ